MSRDDSGNSAVVLMSFMLGAIAGAAVALLYAPQSGAETRRLLQDKARESKDAAAEAAGRSREFVHRQRENLSEAIDRGREAYQHARTPHEEHA